jgi:hypothetical protein
MTFPLSSFFVFQREVDNLPARVLPYSIIFFDKPLLVERLTDDARTRVTRPGLCFYKLWLRLASNPGLRPIPIKPARQIYESSTTQNCSRERTDRGVTSMARPTVGPL